MRNQEEMQKSQCFIKAGEQKVINCSCGKKAYFNEKIGHYICVSYKCGCPVCGQPHEIQKGWS